MMILKVFIKRMKYIILIIIIKKYSLILLLNETRSLMNLILIIFYILNRMENIYRYVF